MRGTEEQFLKVNSIGYGTDLTIYQTEVNVAEENLVLGWLAKSLPLRSSGIQLIYKVLGGKNQQVNR